MTEREQENGEEREATEQDDGAEATWDETNDEPAAGEGGQESV